MYSTVHPFVVDDRVITSTSGQRVRLTVVGIPTDSTSFAAMMRGDGKPQLQASVKAAVDLAADLGCSVVSLGGFTSIVTGNGLSVRTDRIAVTTGNALTVAMAIEAIDRTAALVGIALPSARAAVVGATGNIGSVCAQLVADRVPRLILVGRPGRSRELEAVASTIYVQAVRDLAARDGKASGEPSVQGVAAAIATTVAVRRAIEAGPDAFGATALREAIALEMGDDAPLVLTSDVAMIRDATLVVGASNAAAPVIRAGMLGKGPVLVCDVAVPSDVDADVYGRPDMHIVKGGPVRLPRDPQLRLRAFDLPAGHVFACCAEALVLGLSGKRQDYSVGSITKRQVLDIMTLARMHGFDAGDELRSGFAPVPWHRTQSRAVAAT
jgi:predicted amino acid dehydrogenase